MNVIRLTALLVYAFGAYAYGTILVLWVRQAWGDEDAGAVRRPDHAATLAMLIVCTIWFVVNLGLVMNDVGPNVRDWPLRLLALWLALAFPPLIAHMAVQDRATRDGHPPASLWRAVVAAMCVTNLGLAAWLTLGFAGLVDIDSPRLVNRLASGAISVGFIVAALISIALADRRKAPRARADRGFVFLYWLMVPLFLLVFATGEARSLSAALGAMLELTVKSLPLMFVFVATYSESRFEFFDLFVKRGLSMLVALAVLIVTFALGLPWLRRLDTGVQAAWIFAIVLLPAVLALPWLQARVAAVLDRRWLGRQFTPGEAVQTFITALRSAATEADLVERARRSLSEIFAAPALVLIGDARPPDDFEAVQTTDVPRTNGRSARFVLGPRMSEAPYFSEDVALLASLADVFASLHETVTMQQQQIEQERRTRELQLHASRSEVKALRAQINPHFLFNALNAIAGLTHRDPAAADRTIEQLADVFRYTLRGSLNEWVIVDEEMDVVRAYLEIERTRFGPRFSYSVRMEPAASGARVPAMMIQTLVENAVKHGVAGVLNHASVEVSARVAGDPPSPDAHGVRGSGGTGRLILSVRDNGPGFLETGRNAPNEAASGFGLMNIRRRLEGHFGVDASIGIDRERDPDRTVVAITLPLLFQEPDHRALQFGERVP
jgi:hypothetical protein